MSGRCVPVCVPTDIGCVGGVKDYGTAGSSGGSHHHTRRPPYGAAPRAGEPPPRRRSTLRLRRPTATIAPMRHITQRELRNDPPAVMRAIEAGENFVLTRNGTPIADLVPHIRTAEPRRVTGAADRWDRADRWRGSQHGAPIRHTAHNLGASSSGPAGAPSSPGPLRRRTLLGFRHRTQPGRDQPRIRGSHKSCRCSRDRGPVRLGATAPNRRRPAHLPVPAADPLSTLWPTSACVDNGGQRVAFVLDVL